MSAPAASRATLTDWQRDLADYALHGSAAAATRLFPALGSGPVDIREALDIHAATVHHALFSALRQRLPTVEGLVGEAFLRDLTREFARLHPPRQPRLAVWGTEFPAFVAGHERCATLPWLAAVAAFDLALDEVALAMAGRWLAPQVLTTGLSLQHVDSLRVVTVSHAADQLRDAVAAARDGDESLLSAVSLAPGRHHYAMWCGGDAQVHCRKLDPGSAAFLSVLLAAADAAAGESVVEAALQAALEATGTAAADAGALFTGLLQELATLGAVRLDRTSNGIDD